MRKELQHRIFFLCAFYKILPNCKKCNYEDENKYNYSDKSFAMLTLRLVYNNWKTQKLLNKLLITAMPTKDPDKDVDINFKYSFYREACLKYIRGAILFQYSFKMQPAFSFG